MSKQVTQNGSKRRPARSQEGKKRSPNKHPKKGTKIIHASHASFARRGTAVPSKPCGAAGPRGQLKPYEHSTACQGTVADDGKRLEAPEGERRAGRCI